MNLENFPTSQSGQNMLSYVTQGYYDKSYVAKWLYQVMGLEMDDVRKIIEELPYQAFPETATWGLKYHEIKYQLPVRENLSYEERRKYIYRKRDTRKPINPWRMEQLLQNQTGLQVVVNDDIEPPNTFEVIMTGDIPVNVTEAINELKSIKQSHVSFSMYVACDCFLNLETSSKAVKVPFVPTGTLPKISYAACVDSPNIMIEETAHGYLANYGSSGDGTRAGEKPKVSYDLEVDSPVISVNEEVMSILHRPPQAGNGSRSGEYPKSSYGLGLVETEIRMEESVKEIKVQSELAGTKPEISYRAEVTEPLVQVESETQEVKVTHDITGTHPDISYLAESASSAMELRESTEAVKSIVSMAGDGVAGTMPDISSAGKMDELIIRVNEQANEIKVIATVSGEETSGTVPNITVSGKIAQEGMSATVTVEEYGVRFPVCGDDLGL